MGNPGTGNGELGMRGESLERLMRIGKRACGRLDVESDNDVGPRLIIKCPIERPTYPIEHSH
jgi:hypothetical protein